MPMARIVRFTLVVYAVLLFGAILTFLSAYGAFHGNIGDWTCNPHGHGLWEGRIVFNRWYIDPAQEPWLFKVFFVLDLPSAITAWGIFRVLEKIAPPFQHLCPFGLSAGTYTYGLTLLLSPVQWFLMGRLFALLLRRRGMQQRRLTNLN